MKKIILASLGVLLLGVLMTPYLLEHDIKVNLLWFVIFLIIIISTLFFGLTKYNGNTNKQTTSNALKLTIGILIPIILFFSYYLYLLIFSDWWH